MTVSELLSLLKQYEKDGKGSFPVQIMELTKGITYARDFVAEVAQDYDGDRVWLHKTNRHEPAWLRDSNG
jgi:hypothetical protein